MRSESSEATEEIGRRIGTNLKGGEIIELISDLGGGKTTLVRGIAEGLGSQDKVSSPTFTISKEYSAKNNHIVHYDFYRLSDPGIMSHELAESLHDPSSIVIIEWADIVKDILPENRLTITIYAVSEHERTLRFKVSHSLDYVLDGIESLIQLP